MQITFLTSTHLPKDDRIFYHQAKALVEGGNEVCIISSLQEIQTTEENINFNSFSDKGLKRKAKIRQFVNRLQIANPDVIICPEPITLLAAKKYKNKFNKGIRIIYDITEWYPSKKNLAPYGRLTKPIHFLKFLGVNLLATLKADAFIFGEYYKALPYQKLFPKKKFVYTTYYADLDLIHSLSPKLEKNRLRLSYSGKLTEEKGFDNFLRVVREITRQKPDIQVEIKLIGWYPTPREKDFFRENLKSFPKTVTIKEYGIQGFNDFLDLIADTDVFLDLRSDDFENQRCLPIKLFYYAALERPVIYSDLKAVRKEVEIEKFGYLFKPNEHRNIAAKIILYSENKNLYYEHCKAAKSLVETEYNWANIKGDFVSFIDS